MKRDDLSGLALGGNKARKLQFLIADALARRCDVVVATGYVQSNNVVQTAAAARAHGLASVLVLTGSDPDHRRGNLILAEYLGAELVFAGDVPQMQALEETAAHLRQRGRYPYVLPPGGSTPLGVVGFVEAVAELQAQCRAAALDPDCIFFPTGTGGTQAGLALGMTLSGWRPNLYGVSTGKTRAELVGDMERLTREAAALLAQKHFVAANEFVVDERFYGSGYAKPDADDYATIREIARMEGIFLDPVYTGRAMKGLMYLQRAGELAGHGPILFWNTGGTAALFAFDPPR